MSKSQLVPIIERLDAMTKDETDDVQKRRFDKNNVPQSIVYYHHMSGLFDVTLVKTNETFRFDNIDLVAIEVFESLFGKRIKNQ